MCILSLKISDIYQKDLHKKNPFRSDSQITKKFHCYLDKMKDTISSYLIWGSYLDAYLSTTLRRMQFRYDDTLWITFDLNAAVQFCK